MAHWCPFGLWYSSHVTEYHEVEESRCVRSMRIDFPSASHDGLDTLEVLL